MNAADELQRLRSEMPVDALTEYDRRHELPSYCVTPPSYLQRLAEIIYETAETKGFWEMPNTDDLTRSLSLMLAVSDVVDRLEEMRKGVQIEPLRVPLDDIDYYKCFHALKLLLIISEVAEAFRALWEHEEHEAEELADVFIRLLDYAYGKGYNLDAVVAKKMDKNAGRPHRHGHRF